jgi:predicted RNA-binding protein with TRAM domain
MTRQNVTDGPREILTNRCAVCGGDGFVVSEATVALDVERKLRATAKGARAQAFRVAVHPRVLWLLVGAGGERLAAVEAASRRRFFLEPASGNGHIHLDHFEVLAQGKLEAMRPVTPVEEGATVELKLVELGLYDATAGVGKLGDYEVVVAGAAKLVGKRVTAAVGRALEGVAFAAVESGEATLAPITFEAEADKPTRAPSRKKEHVADVEPEPLADEAEEVEAVAEVEPESSLEAAGEEAVDEPSPDGQPKKKRTRRGSRGGRGRKKAAATADASESADAVEPGEGDAAEETSATDGRPAPRIYVPPPELGKAVEPSRSRSRKRTPPVETTDDGVEPTPTDEPAAVDTESEPGSEGTVEPESDGQPKRKRSRRGSRGGRKRKPAAASGEPASVEGDAEPAASTDAEPVSVASTDAEPAAIASTDAEPAASRDGNEAGEAPEYVPMSEWIEDFETRSRS